MMRFFACVALLLFSVPSFAAEPPLGDVAKHQDLLDLGTDLRLMCVAAHPDDEDGATLSMYRKKYGYKTFAVLATRGEGGQNEIGPELYQDLAVLRTDEMSRASAITGAELHFLNLPEFGYSKSKEETFKIWGYDTALERMVRKIRELRPDVIITHHPPQGAHGHHQGIGQVLQDAFDKSADPSVFPEHIKEGLQPWQVARIYVRQFSGGAADTVRINFNELDPVRGLTYAQIAANALREHKTQGMGFFIDRFLTSRSTATYQLAKEFKGGTQGGGDVASPGGDLFAGLKDRVSADARSLSSAGIDTVDASTAVNVLKKDQAADASSTATARANQLAGALAELRVTAKSSDAEVIPGEDIKISAEAIDFGDKNADKVTFELRAKPWFAVSAPGPVAQTFTDRFATAEFSIKVPADQPATVPHADLVYLPHYLEPQLTVAATAEINGTPVTVESPVYLEVAPAALLEFLHAPYLLRPGMGTAEFTLLVTNHAPGAGSATVGLSAAKGLTLEQSSVTVKFTREGDQKVIPIRAKVDGGIKPGDYPVTATIDGTTYSVNGLVRYVDVKVPADRKVGVIRSYDDTLLITLDRVGVPYDTIETADFTPESLDRFTTILVDIRAYLDRPDLVANNQTLLDYCKRGGTVIVNYHKTIEWDSSFAPYELVVGGQRVTVETAPMTILVPDHPLFNVPNKIVDSDWDNWIQERGLYFPNKWAPEYTPLISVSDPGEAPLQGSCLVAKYGEGTYFYTSLVWYRQLRALNPGAIRIFANMLALGAH